MDQAMQILDGEQWDDVRALLLEGDERAQVLVERSVRVQRTLAFIVQRIRVDALGDAIRIGARQVRESGKKEEDAKTIVQLYEHWARRRALFAALQSEEVHLDAESTTKGHDAQDGQGQGEHRAAVKRAQ